MVIKLKKKSHSSKCIEGGNLASYTDTSIEENNFIKNMNEQKKLKEEQFN